MEEKKYGILNKDFIKKHINYEKELENKIEELENKLKINRVQNDVNQNGIGQYILRKLASNMTINFEEPNMMYGLGGTPINSLNIMPRVTMRVNSFEISEVEFNYLKSLSNEFQ